MRIAAALATARQAAIQKGESVELKIYKNRVTVYTVKAPADPLISPAPLDTLYKVETGDRTVTFSARGFANLPDPMNYIVLQRPGVPDDTVAVSRNGMVKQ